MDTEPQAALREIVTELLAKMGFVVSVEVKEEAGPEGEITLLCAVHVKEDQNFLIGQYGVNLAAIQHIVRVILRKQTGEKLSVVVDVNDYFAGKKSLLEKEAEKAAETVKEEKAPVTLRPMLPYERKIVHAYLANHPLVMTESTGSGEERKVTVRLKEVQENDPAIPLED